MSRQNSSGKDRVNDNKSQGHSTQKQERIRQSGQSFGKHLPRVYGNPFVIALGKAVRGLARLRGGSGSAMPGVVVDKIAPGFAPKVLGALPYGVVVVSGTNGKTTTTKIVTELLESQGLRVFTNSSGSNFMRGVIASLLQDMSVGGRLDADIAVLELDEAHAVHFVKRVAPHYSLLLNVMPDQLDRFGTIEYTASLLRQVAERTTGIVVLNREDAQLSAFGAGVGTGATGTGVGTGATGDNRKDTADAAGTRVCRFGLGERMRDRFLAAIGASSTGAKQISDPIADSQGADHAELRASVLLDSMTGKQVGYEIDGALYSTELTLKGLHNAYNGAGALALVREILADGPRFADGISVKGKADCESGAEGTNSKSDHLGSERDQRLVVALGMIQSAFGRGESFIFNGREIEMLLVKNAGGFSLALESFDCEDSRVMIVVNDEAGDGRDISWLFDVDFTVLKDNDIVMLSGSRAYDMALRLGYDEVGYRQVISDPIEAVDKVLIDAGNEPDDNRPLHIFCTYTAMMRLRPRLIALTGVGSSHVAATDSIPASTKQVNA